MQDIKVSLEIPTKHLNDIMPMTDFGFCIANIVLSDTAYREFYREQVANGIVVIMDNGLYENGTPLEPEELIAAGRLLCYEHRKPILLAPDYFEDKDKTLTKSLEMLNHASRMGFKVGAIPQGKDVRDLRLCYNVMLMHAFEPMCISFLNRRYHFLARQPLIYSRWHHLLGMYDLEELRWIRTHIPFPKDMSIDTVKPIKAAIAGSSMKNHKRGTGKWSPDMDLSACLPTVHANVYELKQYCRGFIEPDKNYFRFLKLGDYNKGSFHKEL